jgi:CBS domain-containing protein
MKTNPRTQIPILTAQDVMTPNPFTVSPKARLFEIAGLFRSHRISGAPVVDGQGRLVGVITITDLIHFLERLRKKVRRHRGALLDRLRQQRLTSTVRDVMTRKVLTVTPDTPMIKILDLVVGKNIHTIPVARPNSKKIIGIIGRHDLTLACLMGHWAS